MSSSSPAPKLPLWVFLLTDAVLVATAGFIAKQSARPLSEHAMFGIVACIIAGATIGLVPLIIYFERQKNDMLDDRQRALEALARTISQSAEQISIAAGGLHEMADLTQRNLKHAELLPHKLQEKIAEFQAQLANANDAEREDLEKELEELRAAETDRLQSTFDKVSKLASDFTKLEAASQQHLAAANDALGRLSTGTAAAISKAQAAAETALAQARQDAAKVIGDAAGQGLKSLEAARAATLADLSSSFEAQIARLNEAHRQITTSIEDLTAAAKLVPQPAIPLPGAPAASASPTDARPSEEPAAVQPVTTTPPAAVNPLEPTEAAAVQGTPVPVAASAPKRNRKQRQEPAAPETVAAVDEVIPPDAPEVDEQPAGALAAAPTEAPAAAAISEPFPPVVGGVPSPRSAEPALDVAAELPAGESAANADAPIVAPAEPIAAPTSPELPDAAAGPANATAEQPKPARKKASRKVDDDQPGLGLVLDEPSHNGDAEPQGVVERVLTSDGATRLIVTAYIGIGNRLFIRGNGPGLSWEKGVPLQFVSIGKWRWETSDASAPIEFKLLKNDEQESATVGQLTIEPGHQHEVTASFS